MTTIVTWLVLGALLLYVAYWILDLLPWRRPLKNVILGVLAVLIVWWTARTFGLL